MATLGQDDIKALEQTRQRLLTLHASLTAMQQNVFEEHLLPSWSSLQTHSTLISNNLENVAQLFTEHHALLASTLVFPSPQFPGRTQEHILQQMLRTKLEPNVEDWVERGQDIARNSSKPSTQGLPERDLISFWQWAGKAANDEARRQKWGADYTLAEKQMGVDNVKTGLQRTLAEPPDDESEEAEDDDADEEEGSGGEDEDEEEDEEEEEQEDKMDVQEVRRKSGAPGLEYLISTRPTAPQMPLENIFRFMMTGSTDRAVP